MSFILRVFREGGLFADTVISQLLAYHSITSAKAWWSL